MCKKGKGRVQIRCKEGKKMCKKGTGRVQIRCEEDVRRSGAKSLKRRL